MTPTLTISDLLPGGLLDTDIWHVGTQDGTCSRCREPIPDDQVPLLLWDDKDDDLMLAFCRGCTKFANEAGYNDEEAA